MISLFEKLNRYKKILKILGRQTVYQQGLMLGELNRKICFTDYGFSLHSDEPKINVTLTTHGKRIFYVHYVLDSLYTQTLRPNKVFLYVTQGEYTSFPAVLKKFQPWLEIIEVENLRSFKKFIPALLNANKEELYVSLDDDFLYPPSMIDELYSLHLSHKNDFVAYAGFHRIKDDEYLGHAGLGILWNPKIFNPRKNPKFFDINFIKNLHKSNDDLYISKFLKARGIRTFCCHDYFDVIAMFVPLPSSELNALTWRGGEKDKNSYISKKDSELIVKELDDYFSRNTK